MYQRATSFNIKTVFLNERREPLSLFFQGIVCRSDTGRFFLAPRWNQVTAFSNCCPVYTCASIRRQMLFWHEKGEFSIVGKRIWFCLRLLFVTSLLMYPEPFWCIENEETVLLASVGIASWLFCEGNVSQHQAALHHKQKTKTKYDFSFERQCRMGGRTSVIQTEILS